MAEEPKAAKARRKQAPPGTYEVRQELTRAGRKYKPGDKIKLGAGEAAGLLRSGALAKAGKG